MRTPLPFRLIIVVCAVILTTAPLAYAEDSWPDFRGPKGDGVSTAKNLPVKWSEKENIVWKTPIEGRAWSSPVILGDQIWMTNATADGHKMDAICFDKNTGKQLFNIRIFNIAKPETINTLNSYASPTPVIEPGRVWVYFGTYGIACLDTATGKILWKRNDLKIDHSMGPGSSPVLYKDKIIFHCDGMDVQYIIALDKITGKTIWKTPRSRSMKDISPEMQKAFSTPLIINYDGKDQLISTSAGAGFAYDPATGKEIWKIEYPIGYSNVSRPVTDGKRVFLNTGYGKAKVYAVRLGGSGDVSDSHVEWIADRSMPIKPSPVLIDGRFYCVSDRGIATCLDATTGKSLWNARLGGSFSASLLYADGHIYAFDHDGKTYVYTPGKEHKEIAVNELDDGCMATPAISGNAIYLRSRSHLYRIQK